MDIEGIEVYPYFTMTPHVESHTNMKTVVCLNIVSMPQFKMAVYNVSGSVRKITEAKAMFGDL